MWFSAIAGFGRFDRIFIGVSNGVESLPALSPQVELLAVGSLSGTARDLSGFTGRYEEGTPCDQIGGFSAIEYTGKANRYWVLADRGPADGAASFRCRMHEIELEVDLASREIKVDLIATVPLLTQENQPLLGSIPALTHSSSRSETALDPEGIRLLPDGSLAISEEYGPAIDLFSSQGTRQRSWGLPDWMALTRESNLENASQGAVPNRGLEGLALTTDRTSLVAAMQGPLVQDSFYKKQKRYSQYTRLVKISIPGTEAPIHWLYPLSDMSCGISEILAVDQHRYLVLERDGATRSEAQYKLISLIDTRDATDVSGQEKLDPHRLPPHVHPVRKLGAIDLLDPSFKIPKRFSLEKPEGLAWGKDLSDGRRTLIVCFDNDFLSDQDSLFLAFAFTPASEQFSSK
jgi:hypothetical protein